MPWLRSRFALTAATLAVLATGCGDDTSTDGGPDAGGDAMPDTGTDSAPPDGALIPDGATLCSDDAECDDGVPCTRDICDEEGYCRNPVDHAVCGDGVFCNGVEKCDPVEGCGPGMVETCSDDDVCTIDSCDEEEKICRHSPRDFDEDGEADFRCEGGTDCDDFDPGRGSTVAELCSDGTDNDCDGMIDEAECGRPDHDACDDPLDVSGGGTFIVSNEGATSDYSLTCGGSGRKDVVASIALEEARDLRVEANGSSITWVGIRSSCTDRDTEMDCSSGFPGTARVRSLEPGTYFIIVADGGTGEIELDVQLSEPTEPAPNQTCDSPTDVSAGGTFDGSFLDVSDDLSTGCGSTDAADLVYEFTLSEPKDVVMAATSASGENMAFEVRSACDDGSTALRCARGAPAGTRMHSLEAGTYFVVVEGPSFREVDFSLDVAFEDPTPPPEGDLCSNAIPLTIGERTLGTLSDKQDDLPTDCGFFYRDAVYSFELTERKDVTVLVEGSGSFMNVAVRGTCDDEASELRCTSGSPARARLRDLGPGTYYAIVESFRGTGFNITVETDPPTDPVEVDDNDVCPEAWTVPETGGLFTGDTTTMLNDYETSSCGSEARSNDAAFELVLTETQHVVASTEGSTYDTVLHVHQDMCMSEGEVYCDDDGGEGTTSVIDRELEAGTWYFIVDGFGDSSTGEYTFEVLVSDP